MSSIPGKSAALSLDSLNNAIRENPLAAGIIGAGIAWLLVGKLNAPSLATMSKPFDGVARSVKSAAQSGTQAVRDSAQAVSSFVSEGLQSASDSVASLVPDPDAVSSVGQAINSGLSSGADLGKQYASSLQRTLSQNLERQPIILGAIGLVIGAGIAAAFPSTRMENEMLGKQGTAAREKISAFVDEVKEVAKDRTQKVVEGVSETLRQQPLTGAAAGDVVNKISQKAKTIAGAAQDAVKTRVS